MLTEREWKACGFHRSHDDIASPVFDVLPKNAQEAAALQRAAQANDAWRAYRGGRRMDDYPGLLSALGKDR